MDNNYLGNPNLKKANVKQEWTEQNHLEYKRCEPKVIRLELKVQTQI